MQDGAVWRFRNEGNRAAFVGHPEIYGPQFGGYDPVDVARGVTVAGNPRFWLIRGQRLYLFGREEAATAFAANPEASCARCRSPLAGAGAAAGAVANTESAAAAAVAPGDEFRHDETFAAAPNRRSAPCAVRDLAAGRRDDRVAGRDVPFGGRRRRG